MVTRKDCSERAVTSSPPMRLAETVGRTYDLHQQPFYGGDRSMKRHITGFLVLAALGVAPFGAGDTWAEEQIGAPAAGGAVSGPQSPGAQAPGAQAPGVQAPGGQVAGPGPGGSAPGGPAAAPGGAQP